MVSLSIIVAFVMSGEVLAKTTERISVDSTGAEGDGNSLWSSISSDGRYVAFHSEATNLVAGDTNGFRDIFVYDRQSGQTTRVSVDSTGAEGDGDSAWQSISTDGRYLAFQSHSTNLVPGDNNGSEDVFIHDRQSGQTTRVSVDSTGIEGDGGSVLPRISGDGRYLAFESFATNLVAGDSNGSWDVFVHDRQTGQTTRVSVDSTGTEGNDRSNDSSISTDGRYVAFESFATNLVAGDTNGFRDVFVHDRQAGQTTRVSVDSTGAEGDGDSHWPSISSDGRYVAFYSYATNLVAGDTNGFRDVFVHDRQTGQTTRVSVDSTGIEGDGTSSYQSISTDGRYVTFQSDATNLVPGDTNGFRDIFVHDRHTGQTTRVSVDSTGAEADATSSYPSISTDGRYVAFASGATNLVAGDTNGYVDVFVHDSLEQDGDGRNAMPWIPLLLLDD
jgi:Tol biopolymer transport system component